MLLGVNIDHIAVLREARKIDQPNPLDALKICENNGVDQITIHLREDRRHIDDTDAKNIIEYSSLPVNLECSINEDIVNIVCKLKPSRATIVPENRDEITTEGGLDIKNSFNAIKKVVDKLHKNSIEVSLFIDPTKQMVELSKELNVEYIEIHTGKFANIYAMLYSNLSKTKNSIKELELTKDRLESMLNESINNIKESTNLATTLGLKVAAGHGLNYENVNLITNIKNIFELNIGQSIIAKSIFIGLSKAINNMQALLKK
jgi:pyridoxine 5-phosphate synthase